MEAVARIRTHASSDGRKFSREERMSAVDLLNGAPRHGSAIINSQGRTASATTAA